VSKAARGIVVSLAVLFGTIALLYCLAWAALAPYAPIRLRMQRDAARTQIGILDEAVKSYHKDIGYFPPSLDALRPAPSDIPVGKWKGPYLYKDVPNDPWNNPYQYATPGTHNPSSFDIWTVSPADEDIGNWNVDGRQGGSGPLPATHN